MLTLYGINLSTFTRKVRLALAEKGIEYRFEVAPMGSARVRERHPLGKIPVVEHEGHVVPDSSVIIAWLERLHPAKPLYPEDARDFARALWLEEFADTRLREVTVPYFAEHVVKPLFRGMPADEQVLAAIAPGCEAALDHLERELGGRPFFVGDDLTVADIAIGAQLLTWQQGGGELQSARWPGLAAHMARLVARPAWAPILAEERAALSAAARARSSAPPGAA